MKLNLKSSASKWVSCGKGDDAFDVLVRYPTFRERCEYNGYMAIATVVGSANADLQEFLVSMVCNWRDVNDMDGNPIPFSQESLKLACVASQVFCKSVTDSVWDMFSGSVLSEDDVKNSAGLSEQDGEDSQPITES